MTATVPGATAIAPASASGPGQSPFVARHIGPSAAEQAQMLAELGCSDLESFVAEVVPPDILLPPEIAGQGLPQGCDEAQALAEDEG